jgi:predicted HicB family RNase H-like nuclease
MKNNTIEYKGYHTKIEFDSSSMSLYGKIMDIDDLVDFEADKTENVVREFHSAVDDYLAFCKSVGKNPCREYRGTFNVRISPELHKEISVYAAGHEMTLNSAVEKAICDLVQADRRKTSSGTAGKTAIPHQRAKKVSRKREIRISRP